MIDVRPKDECTQEETLIPAGLDAVTWAGLSPFKKRVYLALLSVPCGRVTTYADLARAIGCGAPRAVGQALRHNPFAPLVPCHRVIASDGRIGGFSGSRSGRDIKRKRALLDRERVCFDESGQLLDTQLLVKATMGRDPGNAVIARAGLSPAFSS